MFEKDWDVIKRLARLLESSAIVYHFDASTSVFIHGIEFDMDDIDIAFPSSEEALVRKALAPYRQGETKTISEMMKHFVTVVDGRNIHCMFFGKQGVAADEQMFNRNADCLYVDGQKIMAQCVQFYLKYSKKNDSLKQRIKLWLEERKLGFEPYYPIEAEG